TALTVLSHFCLPSSRRHTRVSRDGSSDVCSSDLIEHRQAGRLVQRADNALAPAVRPGVIHRAGGGFLVPGEKLPCAQGQVFAQQNGRASCRGGVVRAWSDVIATYSLDNAARIHCV